MARSIRKRPQSTDQAAAPSNVPPPVSEPKIAASVASTPTTQPLEIIPEISGPFTKFRNTLHRLSHDSSTQPTDAIPRIFETALSAMATFLGATIEIATVRDRSGYSKQRLRPIYSFPQSLSSYFEDQDGKQDGIVISSFVDDESYAVASYDELDYGRGDTLFCNSYRIGSPSPALRSSTASQGVSFNVRIHSFLESLEHDEQQKYVPKNALQLLRQQGTCIVFGRVYPHVSGAMAADPDRPIDQLLAIYVSRAIPNEVLEFQSKDLCRYASEMFRSIDEVTYRARKSFESASLAAITRLIPHFSDPETAPADAVSSLLWTFGQIFSGHSTIGPTKFSRNASERTQWARFLKVEYEVEGDVSRPVLSIYPKTHADINYVNSYLVSRTGRRSISKYLLYSWLRSKGMAPSSDFGRDFSRIKVGRASFFSSTSRKDGGSGIEDMFAIHAEPTGLILTQGDLGWNDLNLDVAASGKETKTTAAFLVFRQHGTQKEVFGILAFESEHHDAFSDADVELLGKLVEASSYLLGHIKIGRTRINFSSLLKEAMAAFTTAKLGPAQRPFEYYRIIYELARCDRKGALELLNNDNNELWQDSGSLKSQARRKDLSDILRSLPASTDQMELIRHTMSESFYSTLESKWNDSIWDVDAFLSAVPSNDVWTCYLSAISRVLSDRYMTNDNPPTFTLFRPGFSAMAMFIVENDKQIRQIVKLSDFRKLSQERERYLKYVRYHIPLAARISANAYAFDTVGWTVPPQPQAVSGRRHHASSEGFGVLVSDLIGGAGKGRGPDDVPVSLLSLCTRLLHGGTGANVTLDNVKSAIRHHFDMNVGLWRRDAGEDDEFETFMREFRGANGAELFIETVARTRKDSASVDGVNARDPKERLISVSVDFSPLLQQALVEVLMLSRELYYKRILPIEAPTKFKSDKLENILKEITTWRQNPIHTDQQLAPIRVNPPFRRSIVHGDLNGNNLTWAANYQRFFLIDFEHVNFGFEGADQLKLLASILCESATLRRQDKGGFGKPAQDLEQRTVEHSSFIRMIRAIRLARTILNRPIDTGQAFLELLDFAKYLDGRDPQLEIAKTVLRTINLADLPIEDAKKRAFWDVALREFMFRQFEYAIGDITERDTDNLKKLAENLRVAVSQPAAVLQAKTPEEAARFVFSDGFEPCPLTGVEDPMRDVRDIATSKLYFAFLALLSTAE